MVTAWSPSCAPRFRCTAGSRRLLLVAVMLFGLVYAHGVNAEGVAAHLGPAHATAVAAADAHGSDSGSRSDSGSGSGSGSGEERGTVSQGVSVQDASAMPAETTGHHDDEHGTSHPAQDCLPGQPQQGPAMEAPGVCTWPGATAVSDPSVHVPPRHAGTSPAPQLRDATGSGILRI